MKMFERTQFWMNRKFVTFVPFQLALRSKELKISYYFLFVHLYVILFIITIHSNQYQNISWKKRARKTTWKQINQTTALNDQLTAQKNNLKMSSWLKFLLAHYQDWISLVPKTVNLVMKNSSKSPRHVA